MTTPREPLARLIDMHGHRVTATVTGLAGDRLVILTATADDGLRDGHPCVNREQAAHLRDALDEFINSPACHPESERARTT